MHDKTAGFIRENKSYCLAFLVLIVVCLTGAWLYHDYARNRELQENTDVTVDRIDDIVERAGQRAEAVERGISESEKAVSGAAAAVADSARTAEKITGGIEACERRLDSIIQRHGRIANILSDIENADRQGAEGAKAPALAK